MRCAALRRVSSRPALCCASSAARRTVVRATAFLGGLFGPKKPAEPDARARSVFIKEEEEEPIEVTFKNATSYKDFLQRQGVGGLKRMDGSRLCVELEELREGETYFVSAPGAAKQVVSIRRELSNESKTLEDELGRAIQQQLEPAGLLANAPELRTIKGPDGKDWMELDAVVVGPGRAYIASHKRIVRDVSDVFAISARARLIKEKSVAGDPRCAAFVGKEIVAVFMAETCSSPKVDSAVQDACRDLDVRRFVRNGTALSVVQ